MCKRFIGRIESMSQALSQFSDSLSAEEGPCHKMRRNAWIRTLGGGSMCLSLSLFCLVVPGDWRLQALRMLILRVYHRSVLPPSLHTDAECLISKFLYGTASMRRDARPEVIPSMITEITVCAGMVPPRLWAIMRIMMDQWNDFKILKYIFLCLECQYGLERLDNYCTNR